MTSPLTEQQLDEYTAIADRATNDPLFLSDCEGSLQVWREKALTGVRRDESGQIDMYSFPSSYRSTDQVIEIDLDSWDPGEDASDDQRRQDINDLVDARAALPVLLAEVRRLRFRLAELGEQGPDDRETVSEAAQMYRNLRPHIEQTMTDPDRWDGDEDESFHLARYVEWLAAEREQVRVEELTKAADKLDRIGYGAAAFILRDDASRPAAASV